MKANIFTLILILLGTIFLAAHSIGRPWTPMRIAGAVIGIPLLALLVLVRIELGQSFAVRAKAQNLVKHVCIREFATLSTSLER